MKAHVISIKIFKKAAHSYDFVSPARQIYISNSI